MTNKSNKTVNSNTNKKKINSNNVNQKKNNNYKSNNAKPRKKDEDLEVTTRIRVDDTRINDAESLDVSFLEGRSKKIDSSKKKKILNDSSTIFLNFTIIKGLLFTFAFVCIFLLLVLVIKNNDIKLDFLNPPEEEVVEIKKEDNSDKKEKVVIDDNYLFVGDYYTYNLDFSDYDYHYVKSVEEKLTLDGLLGNMKSMIYDYNPSIVFLEIGIADINNGISIDEFGDKYTSVIRRIKENRPYAKIYIESIYPLNKDDSDYDSEFFNDNVDNDMIKKYNNKIKSVCDSMNVNYIELYDKLTSNDKLDSEYSDDGIRLNANGNKIILSEINKIVDDEV